MNRMEKDMAVVGAQIKDRIGMIRHMLDDMEGMMAENMPVQAECDGAARLFGEILALVPFYEFRFMRAGQGGMEDVENAAFLFTRTISAIRDAAATGDYTYLMDPGTSPMKEISQAQNVLFRLISCFVATYYADGGMNGD